MHSSRLKLLASDAGRHEHTERFELYWQLPHCMSHMDIMDITNKAGLGIPTLPI